MTPPSGEVRNARGLPVRELQTRVPGGRALWANDGRALRRLLDAALDGHHLEISNRVVPMLRGAGCRYQVWDEAGGHATTDVLEQAPPVYLNGWLRGADPIREWIARLPTSRCTDLTASDH